MTDVHYPCAECGVQVCVTKEFDKEARRTGRTFYCPNGHSLSFTDNEHAREITALNKRIAHLERRLESWRASWDRERDRASAARRLSRTCPLCDMVMPYSRSRLHAHLVIDHHATKDTMKLIEQKTGGS